MRLSSKFLVAAGCCASLAGCPVDDRKLQGFDVGINGGTTGQAGAGEAGQGNRGDAGSQTGGTSGQGGSPAQGGNSGTSQGGSSGASGDSGSGGDAGSSTGGAPVGRCPDLDVNDVLDCDETLATNATFDTSVLPWISEAGHVVADWNEADAHDKTGSGSVVVENRAEGTSLVGIRQCLPVTGGKVYNFGTEAMVPEDAAGAQAAMIVNAYDDPACSGTLLDVPPKQSNYIMSGTGWRVAYFSYLLPANAKSVAVRLLCSKSLSGPPVRVFYDNILVNED